MGVEGAGEGDLFFLLVEPDSRVHSQVHSHLPGSGPAVPLTHTHTHMCIFLSTCTIVSLSICLCCHTFAFPSFSNPHLSIKMCFACLSAGRSFFLIIYLTFPHLFLIAPPQTAYIFSISVYNAEKEPPPTPFLLTRALFIY